MSTNLLSHIFLGAFLISAVFFLTMFFSPHYSGVAVLIVHLCLLGCAYIWAKNRDRGLKPIWDKDTDIPHTPRVYIHVVLILILSARYALYMQGTLQIVNAWLLIGLDIALFAQLSSTYIYQHIQSLGSHMIASGRYFLHSLSNIPSVGSYIGKLYSDVTHTFDAQSFALSKKTKEVITSVLFLVLALLVIIPLLSSADLGFGKMVSQVLDVFRFEIDRNLDINIRTYMKKILFIGVGTLLISVFAIAIFVSPNDATNLEEKTASSWFPALSKTNMYIILGGINIIYILFVISQFAFMFNGNHQAILDRGIDSYSEYIHRGFWQLISISLINIVLYFVFWIQKKQKIRTIMLGILVLCTLVVLVSARMRTMMYIQAYGMTLLRSLVIFALVVIGLICIYLLYRLVDRKSSPGWVIVCICLACRVGYIYINIDATIAQYNISAIQELPDDYAENRETYGPFKKSLVLDDEYIATLSHDSIHHKKALRGTAENEYIRKRVWSYETNLNSPRYNRNRSQSQAKRLKSSLME